VLALPAGKTVASVHVVSRMALILKSITGRLPVTSSRLSWNQLDVYSVVIIQNHAIVTGVKAR